MISPKKGDYISFTRRVVPEVKRSMQSAGGVRHAHAVEPERIIEQGGQGQVRRERRVTNIGGEKVCIVSVDTGPTSMGIIRVVLDESCRMVGEQQSMLDVSRDEKLTWMYGTDGSHA